MHVVTADEHVREPTRRDFACKRTQKWKRPRVAGR